MIENPRVRRGAKAVAVIVTLMLAATGAMAIASVVADAWTGWFCA